MNLIDKKNELIELISKYLNKKCSLEVLEEFSWEMINYFSKTEKWELPHYEEFEKEFWYTIWQIQHLSDTEHEKENITKRALAESLEFLEKKKKMPNEYKGLRPG